MLLFFIQKGRKIIPGTRINSLFRNNEIFLWHRLRFVLHADVGEHLSLSWSFSVQQLILLLSLCIPFLLLLSTTFGSSSLSVLLYNFADGHQFPSQLSVGFQSAISPLLYSGFTLWP